jgi:HAD superfamily, subfamily IIIB (Acid phosphatase)
MKCFLIDIDGTVANGDHRLHHIQKEPKAWDEYFLECGSDAPIMHMHAVVSALSTYFKIVYVSGRSDLVRQQTIDWLDLHGFPCDALYMRKQGDHKNDDVLKIELLAQVRADGFEPIMAFDDRNRVVEAWRAAGIPCAQVALGDF